MKPTHLPRRKSAARTGPYSSQVLDRVMSILSCFRDRDASLKLTDITSRTGLHKSTAYRLLEAMRHHGVVCLDPATGSYRPGLRLFELGMLAVGQFDLSRAAYPVLDALVERTSETAHLCVLDGFDVVYLAKVESKHALRIPSGIGRRNPAYCTAVGKAILAALPEDALTALLDRAVFKPRTRKTIQNVADLHRDLKLTRLRGYAVDDRGDR